MATLRPRQNVLFALRGLARELRGGSYWVKRGAVNWATHAWERAPNAISIQMDSSSLLAHNGINHAQITIEIMARMRTRLAEVEIDDELQDELVFDLETLVGQVQAARDAKGDPVILRYEGKTAQILEVHDVDLAVQGVVGTFVVDF